MTKQIVVADGWLAAAPQWVGTLDALTTAYRWDGRTWPTRDEAIEAGFGQFGHDDFNVGKVVAGQLVWWGWMQHQHPLEDRVEAAAMLGLAAP